MSTLPFPSITVASTNDFYVTRERAKEFAAAWGSKFISIGDAGHINVAAGFGAWPEGLTYLRELDELEL
jgi:predicted alpha/beta hydrolase family esterase